MSCPNNAARPGLVFDSGDDDWLAFLCGADDGRRRPGVRQAGGQRLLLRPERHERSVNRDRRHGRLTDGDAHRDQRGRSRATYTASFTGMTGINVTVSPATFTIRPGRSRTFTVTFTRTTAPVNAYTGGQLLLSDGNHNVRVPMVIRPVALAAPAEVSGTGAPISYPVTFGYSGPFSATARGLVPAATTAGTVDDDPNDAFDPGGEGVVAIAVTIPAGTTHARFSLFDADVTPGTDLDLYVARISPPPAAFVGASGSGGSDEQVDLLNPVAGSYIVFVHGFGVTGTSPFKLFTWLLGGNGRRQHDGHGSNDGHYRSNGHHQPVLQLADSGDEVPRVGRLRRFGRHAESDDRPRRSVTPLALRDGPSMVRSAADVISDRR